MQHVVVLIRDGLRILSASCPGIARRGDALGLNNKDSGNLQETGRKDTDGADGRYGPCSVEPWEIFKIKGV